MLIWFFCELKEGREISLSNIHKSFGFKNVLGNINFEIKTGKKIRLKLFELTNNKSNFIILDEPTNHIDLYTRETLEESLKDFKGTVLFVSHDRYFINKIANKILYIEDKSIKKYVGNYNYFKEHKK